MHRPNDEGQSSGHDWNDENIIDAFCDGICDCTFQIGLDNSGMQCKAGLYMRNDTCGNATRLQIASQADVKDGTTYADRDSTG